MPTILDILFGEAASAPSQTNEIDTSHDWEMRQPVGTVDFDLKSVYAALDADHKEADEVRERTRSRGVLGLGIF